MDVTEAEDIKKRWQENTELYKKIFMIQIIVMVWCLTHLESDILECEVKWALGSISTNKASGGDGIQLSYFKSWKMMLWKCCTQYVSNLENSAVATGLEKVSFHSHPKERQCQRMPSSVQSLSRVWLFATPWTAAHQAPLFMGFSR